MGGDYREGDYPHPNRSGEQFDPELTAEGLTAEALPHQGGGLLEGIQR